MVASVPSAVISASALFSSAWSSGSGPRSPTPGAPYTYVTTKEFLLEFGLDTLRDLPDVEALEDAGLLSKEKLLAGDIPIGLASAEGDGERRDRG